MKRLIVITGDNYQLVSDYIADGVPIFNEDHFNIHLKLFPEQTFNKIQLRQTVTNILSGVSKKSEAVTTQSLFMLRELHIQSEELAIKGKKIPITWINVKENETIISDDLDKIGELVTLNEELLQTERYLNMEYQKIKKY